MSTSQRTLLRKSDSTTSRARWNRLDGIIVGEGQETRWQGQTLKVTKSALRCGGIGYADDALSAPAGEAAEGAEAVNIIA